MPLARKAPKLCPADPVRLILIVSSGRPSSPNALAIFPLSIAPTVRLELLIGKSIRTVFFSSNAGLAWEIN